jgi:hypothetical protein
MEKQKYVMLYNFDTKKEKNEARSFLEKMTEAKLLPYGLLPGLEEGTVDIEKSKVSLWIPESLFLSAWTYFNHANLKRGEITFEDGIDYLSIQTNDSRFYKESFDEGVTV